MLHAVLAAVLATATPTPSAPAVATALPSPSASVTPQALPEPGATVTPSATENPSPLPSATPLPTPTPNYKYRFTPAPNPAAASGSPEILEVDLNDKQLTPHGKIAMRVLTSPDVVKVITRSNGREGPLQQIGPGEFIANGSIPGIPFIAHGWKINIEFVATTADGRTTSVKVPVTLG
jgi:hypothetical protein